MSENERKQAEIDQILAEIELKKQDIMLLAVGGYDYFKASLIMAEIIKLYEQAVELLDADHE